MYRYQVKFFDGSIRDVWASNFTVGVWGFTFVHAVERPSKARGALPSDTTKDIQTYLFISGRDIQEVSVVAP